MFSNPAIMPTLSSAISAKGRMVVTSAAPSAASMGMAMLLEGGNAFDAVVAACLAEGVALPMKCGLGGDLVAIVWEAGKKPEALVSVGQGAVSLSAGCKPTLLGGGSIGAPGAAQGYAALARRGVLPLSRIASPAIELARDGVPWSEYAVKLTVEAKPLLTQYNSFEMPFLPGGDVPRVGERLRLPALADLYREFAQHGDALWSGSAGHVLLRRVQAAGGFLAREDVERTLADWAKPNGVQLQGADRFIWATPGPTHGPDLLLAAKAVIDQGADPVATVRNIRRLKEKGQTAAEFTGTSVVTAADQAGNAVVVVHSNSFPQYGSAVIVPEFSLVLNNRPGRGFDINADAGAPNAPSAGRTPRTTLHAWAAQIGTRRVLGATPGGLNQLPWNVQTLVPLFEGASPAEAILRPRWQLSAAAEGDVLFERSHPAAQGSNILADLSVRSASQILSRLEDDAFWDAAADPRTGAVSMGA